MVFPNGSSDLTEATEAASSLPLMYCGSLLWVHPQDFLDVQLVKHTLNKMFGECANTVKPIETNVFCEFALDK